MSEGMLADEIANSFSGGETVGAEKEAMGIVSELEALDPASLLEFAKKAATTIGEEEAMSIVSNLPKPEAPTSGGTANDMGLNL